MGCYFVYVSCIATKTITLELDAYEKLRAAKTPGESFSELVRRAVFPNTPPSGARLQAYFQSGGSGIGDDYLEAVEQASKHDPVPDQPWG